MKQLKLLFITCLLVFIFILPNSVNAIELKYYGIEVSIKEDFSIHNILTLKFQLPISKLDYQLDFRIYNLNANVTSGSADCKVIDKDLGSVISCDFVGMQANKTLVKLEFDHKSGIRRINGARYGFEVSYGIAQPTKRAFVMIKLPPKGMLAEAIANESYSPQDGNVMTDGKHIIVVWERLNLTTNDVLKFSVLYELPGIGGVWWSLSVMILTLVVVIVMIGVAVYIRKGFKEKPSMALLRKDEKVIVDLLTRHKGEVWQRVLVRESDFSKAKVSRLIKNLKERGVIDIESIGKTNKIILKLK